MSESNVHEPVWRSREYSEEGEVEKKVVFVFLNLNCRVKIISYRGRDAFKSLFKIIVDNSG